jgi:hypothetical protein
MRSSDPYAAVVPRLRDWPDSEWRLVREDPDDPSSPRYFSAYGRDVDQPEQLLSYDEASRHLTIAGGSRKDGRTEGLVQAVFDYIAEHDGCAQVALESGVPDRAEDIRAARDMAVERGLVTVRKVGNRKEHHLNSSARPNSSGRADEVPRDLVPSSYRDEGRDETVNDPTVINLPDMRDEIDPPPEDDEPTKEDWNYWNRMRVEAS